MTNPKIVCIMSYEVDGIEVHIGKVSEHAFGRPVFNLKWRKATKEEIENYQATGNAFIANNKQH